MARINVEDTLWSDSRFLKLCIKLKNEAMAVGVVVLGWKIAQKFWCPDKKPIPELDFLRAGIPEEMIEVGLAQRTKGGIRMCGSEEHFAWWFEKRAAGLKSAEARKLKHGSSQPQKSNASSAKSEHTSNGVHPKVEPLTPSPSLPLSLTHPPPPAQSPAPVEKQDLTDGFKKPIGEKTPTWLTWRSYCEAYANAYDLEPPKNAKNLALCKQLIGRVGKEEAPLVVSFFLKHRGFHYVQAKHPLTLLVRDCEKIFNEMKTGKIITGQEAQRSEKGDAITRAAKSYLEKKHGVSA